MNIMQMMKQAQNLQKKLKETQQELSKMEITGEAGNGAVVVTCDGQGKFKSIKLNPEALDPETPETVDAETLGLVEAVVTTAIINASNNATKIMEEKMKSVTGGINIPGLF